MLTWEEYFLTCLRAFHDAREFVERYEVSSEFFLQNHRHRLLYTINRLIIFLKMEEKIAVQNASTLRDGYASWLMRLENDVGARLR
ncbi:MAG: hypothetical protein A2928_03575 [Candidatus Taylorbacteria bacterium RIFCSPLOWO2_01_FULL_45_15b]|uniref:Uncharacterized protein n=1 Tax=Candidatus Taylorbacteria bacterium RIFCSPLOWO2_01_FULL_45_15b TaxID=1802319 RepID=A0A1G2NB25_9BACT|nr:MAG: hypothetical protein A2928_03575 [Candidatus Taylorbacteria bacterium RIFCSPLOWO2_01_FULL_45_15b]